MKFVKEILFIFLVAVFFAGLTSAVNYALTSRISLNERTLESRYLLDVLGIESPVAAGPELIGDLEKTRTSLLKIDGLRAYRSYDEQGRPDGYAFRFSGKGFWGTISGLLALDADLDTIRGIVFTSHTETPGLGARIDEDRFRNQFKGIKLSERLPKGKFVSIRAGDGKAKNRVDAITGATMTSTLLEKLLNEEIRKIVALRERIGRAPWPSPQKR